jgi:ketosteroid isomerase-like protein
MVKGFDTIKTSMAATGGKISTDKLTYTAGTVNGDTATVTVSGKLTVTANGASQDVDFGGGQATPITLKNEGGTWKVCG